MTNSDRRTFQVIPAVDVLDEDAVRLERGDFDQVTVNAGEPLALVRRLAAARPPLLHLVDLSGAQSGRVRPELVAAAVATAGGIPVQASGGIRSLDDARALLGAGAARVVVGTAAFAPGGLESYADALGERLVVAIDARDGRIAVAGWSETVDLTPGQAAERCRESGVRRILCTAVERDGTMSGPDLALLEAVRDRAGAPVLAAGGVRSEDDLARLEQIGVEGAVVGRALLDGSLPLAAVRAS